MARSFIFLNIGRDPNVVAGIRLSKLYHGPIYREQILQVRGNEGQVLSALWHQVLVQQIANLDVKKRDSQRGDIHSPRVLCFAFLLKEFILLGQPVTAGIGLPFSNLIVEDCGFSGQ